MRETDVPDPVVGGTCPPAGYWRDARSQAGLPSSGPLTSWWDLRDRQGHPPESVPNGPKVMASQGGVGVGVHTIPFLSQVVVVPPPPPPSLGHKPKGVGNYGSRKLCRSSSAPPRLSFLDPITCYCGSRWYRESIMVWEVWCKTKGS